MAKVVRLLDSSSKTTWQNPFLTSATLNTLALLQQTCQLTPIKSVTHAFWHHSHSHTHPQQFHTHTSKPSCTAQKINNVQQLAYWYASPCNRSTPCDVTVRTCGQMTDELAGRLQVLCTAKYSTEHMLHDCVKCLWFLVGLPVGTFFSISEPSPVCYHWPINLTLGL